MSWLSTQPIPPVFLGLGSNVGDRERTLEVALQLLEARGFQVKERSALYLTEPVGGPTQGWFLNMVVRGETALSPEALLAACLGVEEELGRVRDVPNGPRTLDVDLLLYGSEKRDTPALTLPHPRFPDRRFVLEPLLELAPEVSHPRFGLTVLGLARWCTDPSRVERYVAHEADAR